ncbi:hypothetical protein yberc0001_39970 [Yersinia bercovieri ATCC 43970]|uniref:Uncharacterized protein n=1 Tax=Yersinia bercovieri ATCC 43970 TaxID=349968 RepID=A0ABP2DX44_YERBE|nr:hypothetical protein yberc0001_39970 [Yersinia bercovieri ATCC 43970]
MQTADKFRDLLAIDYDTQRVEREFFISSLKTKYNMRIMIG